jgi:Cu+-exporting ATPase
MEKFNYEVYIKGMKCSSCSNKVESTVRASEGVKSATVNLITERMFISLDGKGRLEEVKKIIHDLGFNVTSVNDLSRSTKGARVMKLYDENGLLAPNNYVAAIRKLAGVVDASYSNNVIIIEYDPLFINGTLLFEKIKEATGCCELKYRNEFVSSIADISQHTPIMGMMKLVLLMLFTSVLVMFTMLLPKETVEKLNSQYVFNKFSLYLIIVLILSSVIVVVYGLPIYAKTIRVFLKKRMVNMETLITLGSISAILLCFLNLFRLSISEDHFDMYSLMVAHAAEASATVISILLFGKCVEDRARNNIKTHTSKIFSDEKLKRGCRIKRIKPGSKNFKWLLEEAVTDAGLLEKDDFCELTKDDFLLVDCVILSGTVEVNENSTYGSLSTVEKSKGDKLKSGTEVINVPEKCFVMIEEVLENSLIYKITREMSNSLNQKMKFQKFIDRVVRYFVPFVVSLSILTLIIWLCIKYTSRPDIDLSFIFERSISILVISCPCAFGLAIPTVTTIALNKALKYGILIKNLDILPEIRKSSIFVFDKTGTLTEIVKDVNIEHRSPESNNYPIFEILAQIEKSQKHPLAEVIYSFCVKAIDGGEHLKTHIDIVDIQSYGIVAKCNGEYVLVGNYKLLEEKEIQLTGGLRDMYERLKAKNLTIVFVVKGQRIELILSIDTTSEQRKEAQGVMHLLPGRKIILSGDNEESVKELGKHLGIRKEDCYGQVDSLTKKDILQDLRQKGKVLMIGDGINDILSLSEADFGISFNSNSHLNLVASDIIFVKQDLSLVLSLLRLSKITHVFILINIFWAFSYNIMMLPIAAGVFHSIDFDMTPTSSSFSMLCSSLLIVLTSNIIRLFKLDNFKEDLWIRNTIITVKTTSSEMEISDIDIQSKKKVMLTKRKEGYIELV